MRFGVLNGTKWKCRKVKAIWFAINWVGCSILNTKKMAGLKKRTYLIVKLKQKLMPVLKSNRIIEWLRKEQ
jgi:hypothetical protein